MRLAIVQSMTAFVTALFTTAVFATGGLHILNLYGNTPPELIEKFALTYDVSVRITGFSGALAEARSKKHGIDIVVTNSHEMPSFIEEGLVLETRPSQMENYNNVAEYWRNPKWDLDQRYSVPWLWIGLGISVNSAMYKGDVNTLKLLFDPPAVLEGKIKMTKWDMIQMAKLYEGSDWCTSDEEVLKRVRDLLIGVKSKWKTSNSKTNGTIEELVSGEIAVLPTWMEDYAQARTENPDIWLGYPVESIPLYMEYVVVLKDAINVENAKLFQNFLMDPENAALISNYSNLPNAIVGSEAYMLDETRISLEAMTPEPRQIQQSGRFVQKCPPEVDKLYETIWTEFSAGQQN